MRNRIIVHLSRYSRVPYSGAYPWEMTQEGMAQKLGIKVGNLSVQVGRLVDDGCIGDSLEHVKRARTRRKIYKVTGKGDVIARELMERRQDGKGGGSVHIESPRDAVEWTPEGIDPRTADKDRKSRTTSTYSFFFYIDK